MGAAYRSNSKGPDTRKPNTQPNAMPALLDVVVLLDGEQLGRLGIPQRDKLSAQGNVTYDGGIAKDLELEGVPTATLGALAFVVNGTTLTPSAHSVHESARGNKTIGHFGSVELPVAGDAPRAYQVKAYATHSTKKGTYSLSVGAFPRAIATGGPQVIGTISGSFSLRAPATAAA